jgi:aspartate aminotransferase
MRLEFNTRRIFMLKQLAQVPGFEFHQPRGAFYVLPRVTNILGKLTPAGDLLRNDVDVANYLLDTALVALVPGTPFGAPGHLRLSYALNTERLGKAIDRIGEAVAALRDPGA